jgi:hypothetical protein
LTSRYEVDVADVDPLAGEGGLEEPLDRLRPGPVRDDEVTGAGRGGPHEPREFLERRTHAERAGISVI